MDTVVDGGTKRLLEPIDYVIFAGMLLISSVIGIYYAYRDRNSKRGTEEYLMANRSMGVIPVAISLAVSFKSALTVLGIPADVYQFGMMYIWTIVSLFLVSIVVAFVFIPTLYSLEISSTYEYLEKRFSRSVRLVTTAVFLLQYFMYLGVNIYAPALALSEVTGFQLVPAMLSTGLVCIFYTTLGGLRGVVWTDVFQGLIMLVGLLAFIIRGSVLMGGFTNIWSIASDGGRTHILRFETDPRIRYTVWSVTIGGFIMWLGVFGTNQAQVQRLLSVKSQAKSKNALFLGVASIALYSTLGTLCGIVLYAYYHECDPLSAKCVKIRDQLMPFAILDFFRDLHGLPGVFISCVFSASLSTVSSGINAMITVTVEDFVKPFTNWTERTYTWTAKGLAVLFGAVTLGISFLASVLGDIVSVGIASVGAFIGPSLGIFLLGIWFPFANARGALFGFFAGAVAGMTLFFAGRTLKKPNYLLGMLDVNTNRCPSNCSYMDTVNITYFEETDRLETRFTGNYNHSTSEYLSPAKNFYALSYFYIASVGMSVTLLCGITTSLLSCGWRQRHEVDVRLIRPPFESKIFSWIPDKIRAYLRCGIVWKEDESIAGNDDSIECKALADETMSDDFNQSHRQQML